MFVGHGSSPGSYGQENGPILMLTDSMLRGIQQKKLDRDKYINKQYIAGGTAEMLTYVKRMADNTEYKQVVIHEGTNDIHRKSQEEIINGIMTA